MAQTPNADADVIAICNRFLATRKAFNDSPRELDSDDNPAWPPHSAAWDAVDAVDPTTLPGLIALAQVVACETGMANEMDETPATWALRIVKKLTQMDLNGADCAKPKGAF